MNDQFDIQFFGMGIRKILENFHIPSDDFHLEIKLSTQTFDCIRITWQHFLYMEGNTIIPKVDFLLLDDHIYSLLESNNYKINKYGVIIGIPYPSFDIYIKNFPEELSRPDCVSKMGNNKGISWYYELQRRKLIGTS